MTPKLGEFFNKKSREKSAIRALIKGVVLKCKVKLTDPPKVKRFVVIGKCKSAKELGILFINSNINENLFPTSYLKSLHIELKSNHRAYLDRDSYIDCSQIYPIKYEKLKEKLINAPGIKIGDISEKDMLEIVNKIKSAKTISQKDKIRFNII